MISSSLNRINISGDLRHIIRQMIAEGELAAGERINEVHLSESLEVSRTPLREALSQLTAEGLVDCKPRRGFFTRSLSMEELKQLYPLRGLLDPEALRQAGIPSRKRISELRRINKKLRNPGDAARAITLDDDWHRLLLAHCSNQILMQLIDQLIWKSRRYEFAYLSQGSNIKMATDEHEAILTSLDEAKLSSACRMLKQNMMSARNPLISWLKSLE